jgi:enterobacteria phage integrase
VVDSAGMGRPKQYDLPDNCTFDVTNGVYVVRNPLTKNKRSFADKAKAVTTANALNKLFEVDKQRAALTAGGPTIAGLCAKWLSDKLQFMPWAPSTAQNYVAKINRISRELGARTIAHTDCMYLEEWIASFAKTADTFNDWRYVFVLLWRFAVSRKLAEVNEAEKIEERSTSKKIDANKKQRQPLDIEGFQAIHEKASPWLQLALEETLVTLQARLEICNMRHDHHRDGFLYVIRNKVSGDSDMAFIRIGLTEQLLEFQSRARKLDESASPYIIHRKPEHLRREWIDASVKPHWTYVMPDYLGKAFAHARDQIDRFKKLPPRERPTHHEARGLGSRIYEDQGMSKAAIQALMTHANPKTTKIYLDGGAEALSDDDYHRVVAPLVLRDVLR